MKALEPKTGGADPHVSVFGFATIVITRSYQSANRVFTALLQLHATHFQKAVQMCKIERCRLQIDPTKSFGSKPWLLVWTRERKSNRMLKAFNELVRKESVINILSITSYKSGGFTSRFCRESSFGCQLWNDDSVNLCRPLFSRRASSSFFVHRELSFTTIEVLH